MVFETGQETQETQKESGNMLTAAPFRGEKGHCDWRRGHQGMDESVGTEAIVASGSGAGTRKASRFQRAVRLFRFHQVSRDDAVGIGGRKKPKVHPLVRALFKNLLTELCWEDSAGDRPSSIITSRVLVHDPRTPPVVRIEPKVPPDCHRMRFNAALGWRWHRFTLSPGKVQILVQGPILVSQVNNDDTQRSGTSAAQHVRSLLEAQLHGDTVNQPPKFIIPTNDGEEGVEVKAKPWHEVQVQYALTDLGRPDGSTGGFYGLMRRTRFIKLEVLRRLFAEDGEAFRPGLEDFRDETLSQPLTNALASLESAPRPPGWNLGDDGDLHVLDADSTMRTRMLLQYEKNELKRDIVFLKGCFEQREGRLQMPGSGASEDLLVETMTVQEAMARCHTLRGCGGFCFQGDMTTSAVTIHFKGFGHEAVGAAVGWTSFYFEHGERALIKLLAQQYQARFCDPEKPCKSSWVPDWLPRMAFHLGYVADSDEEGQPPKKRLREAKDVNLESSKGEGPPKRRQTLLAFAAKVSRCLIPEVSEPPAAPAAPEAPEAPDAPPAPEGSDGTDASEPAERFVGYTLWLGGLGRCQAGNPPAIHWKGGTCCLAFDQQGGRWRRVVTASLRRYGHLLHLEELQALRAFESLSLPAQQLYARLLSRKWPQWVSYQGLGARYKELGEAAAKEAAAELASPTLGQWTSGESGWISAGGTMVEASSLKDGEWGPLLDTLKGAAGPAESAAGPAGPGDQGPWLLDSAAETAGSLLQRALSQPNCQEDNYGKLLLSALPVAELRRMGRGLGTEAKSQRGKGRLVESVCAAATKQRLLQTKQKPYEAVEALVSQALRLGRWLCCADSWGRRALVLLGELFRSESCGAAEVSFVLFTTKWPEFSFQEARPLFADRKSLDNFLAARAMVAGEDFQRHSLESAESDASVAEEGLRQASSVANDFEAAKLRDPFRRRFTAAWCYAEALHHAVTNSPAVGQFLRTEGHCVAVALEIAAQGLAEGMDMARPPATVDLTSEMASSQEVNDESNKEDNFGPLPRDARWDLARRCRTLAKAAQQGKAKAKTAWRLRLQKTQARTALVPRELEDFRRNKGAEAAEMVISGEFCKYITLRQQDKRQGEQERGSIFRKGPIRNLTATKLGLPQVAPAESNGIGPGRRRMFDGFRLEELTVEELAMQHYLGDGGNFQCGIHCEGAVLRDLFGLLLFDQMFHCSVEGAFVSAFQDLVWGILGKSMEISLRTLLCTAFSLRLLHLRGATPRAMAMSSVSRVTGLPPGPFPFTVKEIWYPAGDEARDLPRNRFSEFLGRGTIPGSIQEAEEKDAIGGYRNDLTIKELDKTWPNEAVRDARIRDPDTKTGWPLVIFSHGSGAYRASYIFFTEFLASQGFVVMACDHPGSARYTQVNGRVIKPGGARSERSQMEADRPKDVMFLLDAMSKLAGGQDTWDDRNGMTRWDGRLWGCEPAVGYGIRRTISLREVLVAVDSRFAGRVNVNLTALTGMSFGGWTTAACLEESDPRVKAAIMMCPSLMSAGGRLIKERRNMETPIMMMIGSEDYVLGSSFLLEIKLGGHCSFTSCELYNPSYGNGIGESKSLTKPEETYQALEIAKQHEIINSYALAFLDKYLRAGDGSLLKENRFQEHVLYRS
eukprot:s1971_g6.t1